MQKLLSDKMDFMTSSPKNRVYIVTDVEGTGQSPKDHGIITLTMIPVLRKAPSQLVLDCDGLAECYYTTNYEIAPPLDLQLYVGSEVKVDPKAMEVNGIDLKKHNEHPDTVTLGTFYEKIKAFLKHTKEAYELEPTDKLTWAGWSFGYDINMINATIDKWEKPMEWPPEDGLVVRDNFLWTPLDVKSIAMGAQDLGVIPEFEDFSRGGQSQLNLGRLAQHYGLNTDNLHSARIDVELTILVLNKLMADLDPNRRRLNNLL